MGISDEVAKVVARSSFTPAAQAIVQAGRDKESEAIALYDIILTAQPSPDPELKYAAMIGKGDSLLALGPKRSRADRGALRSSASWPASPPRPPPGTIRRFIKKRKVFEQSIATPRRSRRFTMCSTTRRATTPPPKAPRTGVFLVLQAGFDVAVFRAALELAGSHRRLRKNGEAGRPAGRGGAGAVEHIQLEHFIPWSKAAFWP